MKGGKNKKKLIIRLSSLGDLIILSAVLNQKEDRASYDILTLEEYGPLFVNHPRVNKVWSYQKKQGIRGWIILIRQVFSEHYDEILDLHRSLRTRVAFFWDIFFIRSKSKWVFVKKYKFRKILFNIFKRKLPQSLRPPPWWKAYAQVSQRDGKKNQTTQPPYLGHLLSEKNVLQNEVVIFEKIFFSESDEKKIFYAVMPSSRWEGKKWPLEYFKKVIQKLDGVPIVLGTPKDLESQNLVNWLEKNEIPFHSLVGNYSFIFLMQVLKKCSFLLGNDTGLSHLAESIGVPSFVLFGPTHPDAGFSPWSEKSLILETDLWCRPCGKDGRFCFRMGSEKYLCMKTLTPEKVLSKIQKKLQTFD